MEIAGIKLGHQGAKGKLTTEQRTEIIEWLKTKDYWYLDELINHLEDKYDVIYKSRENYYNLFEAGKIRWKRSQKVNPKNDRLSDFVVVVVNNDRGLNNLLLLSELRRIFPDP